MRHERRWRVVAAAAIGAVGVTSATAVVAATVDTNEPTQIHACVSRGLLGLGKGSIRVVEDPTQCRANEDPLTWNQQGIPGEPGPQGPQGLEGPTGPTGPSGLAGYEHVLLVSPDDSESPKTVVPHCPPGKTILTGGANVVGDSNQALPIAYLVKSFPLSETFPATDAVLWFARAGEPTPTDRTWSLQVSIWCVDDPTP